MVRGTLGQYVTVCPRLPFTSHTQPISTPSRIKSERYILIKKRVRSFIEVRQYVWLCSAYICIVYMYMCSSYSLSIEEYENFVNAHLEAAVKCIPTKLKTKYRVPWETLAVREKRAQVKTASKNYRKHPTNTNALKLKTAQYQLAGTYIKEQTEYIQNQIDKIRDSVEDRESRIAWQTINEGSRRKNTAKAKLKAANQQERIKQWKQHL